MDVTPACTCPGRNTYSPECRVHGVDRGDRHPSDTYDWNLPGYDPTGDPYFEKGAVRMRPGDPENLNDLGPVFIAECWRNFDEGCGWTHGPESWTPAYRALDDHEERYGHLGDIRRIGA